MMRTALLLVILALAPLGIATATEPLRLNSSVVVDGASVTVGDLFEGAIAGADMPLFPAPAPGDRALQSLAEIRRATEPLGLAWTAAPGTAGVEIVRSSTTITQEEIEDELRLALIEQGASERLELRLFQRNLEIAAAAGAPVALTVEDLRYDPRTGRFDGLVVVSAEGSAERTLRVSGRAHAIVDLPVPIQTLRPGTIIAETDLEWIAVPEDRLDRRIAQSAEELIGLSVRRALRPGEPVRLSDLEAPRLVTKGRSVTMIYETPFMRLTAIGRALEDGTEGNTVRVLNVQSNTVVHAVVAAENLVRLSTASLDLASLGIAR
ncbi:MAG TPA: flagellar basal body P-ring formation chaperone FlgA [Alphaproteobacteria bacterium]|nr:flagellar basal body P-ring formation chaperone FlgA [Alphaproteobacteria bacterium]